MTDKIKIDNLDNNNESEVAMLIYNARHEQKNERKKFISLRAGDVFIHRGRVMIRLDYPLHRVTCNGDKYALEQVNAIRLGQLDDAGESAKIAGKPSVISDDTEVEVIDRNVAGLYLRG